MLIPRFLNLQVSNLFIVMIVMNVLPQLPVSFGIQ